MDRAISADEVTAAGRLLARETIRIVDQDGDEKISPEELRNAISPSTLARALMNFLDGPGPCGEAYESLNTNELGCLSFSYWIPDLVDTY